MKQVPKVIFGRGSFKKLTDVLSGYRKDGYIIFFIDHAHEETGLVNSVPSEEGDLVFVIDTSSHEPKTDQIDKLRDSVLQTKACNLPGLIVGIGGVIVSMVIGVFIGLICGFYRGIIDAILSRIIDTLMSIPFILLAISIVGMVGISGNDSLIVIIIVLGLTGWITFARVIRAEVLSIREKEYVESAYAIGQTNFLIIIKHILPNVIPYIIVLSTLQIATVIIAESSLSFLGLGVKPPIVTWGSMLADGRDHLATSWWLATFPGLAITFTTLGLIIFGDWLRDYLDPKMNT